MIQYQFFPRSRGLNSQMQEIINVFKSVENDISSDKNDLVSNAVLNLL